MADRLRGFVSLLADDPRAPTEDQALGLFAEGWSINQAVSRLAPQLGGAALLQAQIAVEHQARGLMHQQPETVEQQQAALEEWQEYAGKLEANIEALQGVIEHQEATIATRRRALAQK